MVHKQVRQVRELQEVTVINLADFAALRIRLLLLQVLDELILLGIADMHVVLGQAAYERFRIHRALVVGVHLGQVS